ncbi:DUF4142 domain-containing protein [Ramlibacter sp. G-1-2-2]|uniref:DUF4142 domain-containing protein n=1 Tax=Ramlibacter agri TaxID=2728837 RepID=A0A848HIV9_9BURK|nr:DUF4142 domain-containing protein [Ramlibacter agri]NML47658.1 DUF4142 domain-containing protein [Ramlibacter agri]
MQKTFIALALFTATGLAFAAVDKADQKFMEKAAGGNMAEVEVGKMVEGKAQDASVKAFGSTLVKDHSAANDELKALASSKGVTLPSSLPRDEQKKVDKLNKSKHFEKDFVKDSVKDHKKDIKEFEKASKDAKDPDVKAWATKTLPTLQAHLQTAEGLEKDVKGK